MLPIFSLTITALLLSGCMKSQSVFFINGEGFIYVEEFSKSSSALGWDAITPEEPTQVNVMTNDGFETGERTVKPPTGFEYFQETVSEEFFSTINPQLKNGFSKNDCQYGLAEEAYFMLCSTQVTEYPFTELFDGTFTPEIIELEMLDGSVQNVQALTLKAVLSGDAKMQKTKLDFYTENPPALKSPFLEGATSLHTHEDGEQHSHDVEENPDSVITIVFEEGYIHNVDGEGILEVGFDFFEIDLKNYNNGEITLTVILDIEKALEEAESSSIISTSQDFRTSLILIIVATLLLITLFIMYMRKNKKTITAE